MAYPIDTDIWIKCHEEETYQKIFQLMEDEDFMAQFHDTLQNKIVENACDDFEFTIAISAIETGERDSDYQGALEIAKKLTFMFHDIMAMVDVHTKRSAWRRTYKNGVCIFAEYCRDSYYSDGDFRATDKKALLKIDSEDEIWKEFLNYQPQGNAEIDPMHKGDWKVLADLSDMVAKGEFLALTDFRQNSPTA